MPSRGRGTGSNPFHTEFPRLNASTNKDASSQSIKDELFKPKEQYTPNSINEERILYIEPADAKWMSDP